MKLPKPTNAMLDASETLLLEPGNIFGSAQVIETRFIKGRTVRVERKKRRGK